MNTFFPHKKNWQNHLPFLTILIFALISLQACTKSVYKTTNSDYKKKAKQFAKILAQSPLKDSAGLPYASDWVGTTNFSQRKPGAVVIHHTAQNSCGQTLRTFTLQRTQVSAHYVICEDGTVHHMLNDLLRAHHAGAGQWGGFTDINSNSIGIEIDNDGYEPFTELQIQSLLSLLSRLKKTYNIPTANFIGHADIAPGRKVDPNRNFPWQRLAGEGFGYWYDTTNIQVPPSFEPELALRIIGYNVKNFNNAIQSYKIHFNSSDTTKLITESDRKILYSLLQKYK